MTSINEQAQPTTSLSSSKESITSYKKIHKCPNDFAVLLYYGQIAIKFVNAIFTIGENDKMKSYECIFNAHQQLKAVRQLVGSAEDLRLVEPASFAVLIQSIELTLLQGLEDLS